MAHPRSVPVLPAVLCAALWGCDPKDGDTGPDSEGSVIDPTEHCGTVSGSETWSPDGNPHWLTCDVEVTGDLTLDPGVEVFLQSGTTLRVTGGTLTAAGTENDGIVLEGQSSYPQTGDHGGLVATDATITLSWFTVRHGGAQGAVIDLTGGTAALTNVAVSNGPTVGISAIDTLFTAFDGIDVAYTPEPLILPWSATAFLTTVHFETVDNEVVRLVGDTLDLEASVGPLDYPYITDGSVTVVEGGKLEIVAGGALRTTGDITVDGGSIAVYGEDGVPARLEAAPGTTLTVRALETATAVTFRYAELVGGGLECASDNLFFVDSAVTGAPGAALTLTGGVWSDLPENLSGNVFASAGPGLVVGFEDLLTVGTNDYTATSFDGVAVLPGTTTELLSLGAFPSPQVLVQGDLTVASSVTLTSSGTLVFADGATLRVDGGTLQAQGVDFTHAGAVAGGWNGITVAAGADATILDGCRVAYGGAGGAANVVLAAPATVRNSQITDSAGWGIAVEAGVTPSLEDNVFSDNALGDVEYR